MRKERLAEMSPEWMKSKKQGRKSVAELVEDLEELSASASLLKELGNFR